MILAILSSLGVALGLAYVISFSGANTLLAGAKIGVLVELGFIATLLLGDVVFEKRPWKLFLLRNGYNLTAFAVIGAILAVWK